MTEAEFENETRKHQQEVAACLQIVIGHLSSRAMHHDASKLVDPERSTFLEWTPKLKALTYGSDEYKAALAAMKPALDHHYEINRHHPEHYDSDDPVGHMDLIDVIEMVCDWHAATKRHADGDILMSIEHNESRFGINPQLSQIVKRTVRLLC